MTDIYSEYASIIRDLKEHISNLEILELPNLYMDPALVTGLGKQKITRPKTQPKSAPKPSKPSSSADSKKKVAAMEELNKKTINCTKCDLHENRRNLVFGEGNPAAELVIVGEAPGYHEDIQGKPFVGRAGQLLTKMISAMGLDRKDVYICNVLKCRPPENRDPRPEEIIMCEEILLKQLDIIKPKVICAMGRFAAQTLLKTTETIGRLRGIFHDYHGIPLMPTYHPAYLLRNPNDKRKVWEDIQQIMVKLDLPINEKYQNK